MPANDLRPGVSACPGRDELLAFHLGKLPRDALDALAAHLDACPSCAAVAEDVHGVADILLEVLVQPLPPDPVSESEARRVAILLEELGGQPTRPADLTPLPSDGPGEDSAAPPHGGQLGQYELLEELGAGAMGQVFKARHRLMERVVAVKILHPHCLRRPQVAPRFVREIRALARLDHPNIVRALDADQAGTIHFLVMEYVEGTTLDKVVEQAGPLPVTEACDAVCQAALGLQHAFEHGLIHRDVKPANLIRTPAGQVKVLDLGLALFHEGQGAAARPTMAGQVLGTLEYMAPEQWEDTRAVDIRADIYSLGCTLYHLLAGRPPFSTPAASVRQIMKAHAEAAVPPIREQRPDVPEGLAAILARMLAKDPRERYATPAEVAAALRPFVALPPGPADRACAPPAAAPTRPGREKRLALLAAAVVLIGLLVGGLCKWYGLPAGPETAAPPSEELRISTFRIEHFGQREGKPLKNLGDIGIGSHPVRLGDDLRFHVALSDDAHCFLILFNPNGEEQRCYPRHINSAPPATRGFDYPSPSWELKSTDGVGLMVVVLVASRKELPPFPTWRQGVGPKQWQPTLDDRLWYFDGRVLEPVGEPRGQVRGGAPPQLEDLCNVFKTSPGADAVVAWAFPVGPKK